MRFLCFAAIVPLLLSGCDINSIQPGDSNALAGNFTSEPLHPDARPVRVGESGQQFAACPNRGTVVNLGPNESLVIRAAPFADAEPVGELATGAIMAVCTRSIDQRWLGVVVAPVDAPETDCGVEDRLERARNYAGPCLSGWVTNGFVRLGAR